MRILTWIVIFVSSPLVFGADGGNGSGGGRDLNGQLADTLDASLECKNRDKLWIMGDKYIPDDKSENEKPWIRAEYFASHYVDEEKQIYPFAEKLADIFDYFRPISEMMVTQQTTMFKRLLICLTDKELVTHGGSIVKDPGNEVAFGRRIFNTPFLVLSKSRWSYYQRSGKYTDPQKERALRIFHELNHEFFPRGLPLRQENLEGFSGRLMSWYETNKNANMDDLRALASEYKARQMNFPVVIDWSKMSDYEKLQYAIWNRDVELMERFLREGVDINARNEFNQPLLGRSSNGEHFTESSYVWFMPVDELGFLLDFHNFEGRSNAQLNIHVKFPAGTLEGVFESNERYLDIFEQFTLTRDVCTAASYLEKLLPKARGLRLNINRLSTEMESRPYRLGTTFLGTKCVKVRRTALEEFDWKIQWYREQLSNMRIRSGDFTEENKINYPKSLECAERARNLLLAFGAVPATEVPKTRKLCKEK